MAAFDEREKDFEARYKHDQELQFKVKARRNRLLGLWAAGLVWVARGVVRGKRWAFTPTLFTQLIFGVIAVSVFGAAGTAARVVWGCVLALAVVVLRLLLSREAREHLVYSNAKNAKQ